MEQDINAIVEAMRSEIVELCQSLVRINTVNPYSGDRNPGGEAAGQRFLAPILEQWGAQITLFDSPADIYDRVGILGPRNRNFTNRPNLVAEFKFSDDGPRIVINGHMDTVGIDNMPGDPLSAELRDGRILGRGTSDCKGGLTVACSAVQALLRAGVPLRGSIVLQAVMDEECNGSGAGTLACLDAGYTGDFAIFVDGGEGTLTMGCNGCLTADLFVEGQEGHAALGNGVSAIDKGLIIKTAIDQFKLQRETEWPDCRVNLGIFHAGLHPAVIPGSAYLSLNAVYDVSEARVARDQIGQYGGAQIREHFESLVKEANQSDEWLREHPTRVEWVKDLIPYEQDAQDPWVVKFHQAFEQATGRTPVYDKMVAWSDAAHPVALFGIPTVLYGPGIEGTAHSNAEYVTVDSLVECTKVIATFLLEQLGSQGE